MDQESSEADLERFRLETHFGEASVRHTIFSPFTRAREEEWRRAQVVGRGGFGVVHLEHGPKNRVRAVKVIDKTTFSPGLDFTRELAIMSFLTKHGGSLFVQFLGWFEESEGLHIAMEYFEKGDLRRHLGERMSVPTAKLLARQLLEGLSFMHKSGIAHRDLKPENIFVVSLSPLRVKLGDFGVSKCINEHTMLRTQIFTRSYSAPEILGVLDPSLETSEYTRAVDIWSLGCVIFEVLTGSVLFQTEYFLWHFCYGKAELMLEPLREAVGGEDGFEFVRGLLSPDAMGRPSAVDALRDPWLKMPRIRKVKERGDTLAHVVVRPQIRAREVLPPVPPGGFAHVSRFNEILEKPLARYPGPGGGGDAGGQGSTIHGIHDVADWQGLPYATLTDGPIINGALAKPLLPLPWSSKDLGFCLGGLLVLAFVLFVRPEYRRDRSGGTSNDAISSLFASALGLWLTQEAWPESPVTAEGGSGALDASLLCKMVALERCWKNGVGRDKAYVGGRPGGGAVRIVRFGFVTWGMCG